MPHKSSHVKDEKEIIFFYLKMSLHYLKIEVTKYV